MSIADKLQTIAENEQKVYDAGYAKGKAEGGGGDSGDSYYDAFWDAYQENGARTNYNNAFKCEIGTKAENYKLYSYWNLETFTPKYDITPILASSMFHSFNNNNKHGVFDLEKRLKERGVTLDVSNTSNVTFMFGSAGVDVVPELLFTEALANMDRAFYNAATLRVIRKIKSHVNLVYSSTFYGCSALEEIAFDGVIGHSINFFNCKNLTAESIQSIIDALADLTGGTAQTLTLPSNIVDTLTDEQWSIILSKNWIVG